ncbi:MAG: recombinase family protein [Thermoleophilaceae bacterium]
MSEASQPPAVIYAAKSTDDTAGSIDGQITDCRALADTLGFEVIAVFKDEAKSGYHGNRGHDLARMMQFAEKVARERGTCNVLVQHSDRLGRGDGKRARHTVEYALWALKNDLTLHSAQDPQTFGDLLYAVVTGQRNHEDSARKAKAVKSGLERRKAKGEPVGAIPLGYVHTIVMDDDGAPRRDRRGNVITERVIDPVEQVVYDRLMDLAEAGHAPGGVARKLNAEGYRTKPRRRKSAGGEIRGTEWTPRKVRRVIQNEAYMGTKGYPRLIAPDRWQRINERLIRMDPAAVQRRKGGRPVDSDDYVLRGIAFCAKCGSSLYTRRYATGRHYVCGAVREARGTCDAGHIPAELGEAQVLNHLSCFIGSVEDWLAELVNERQAERHAHEAAVERHRSRVAKLEAERGRRFADYRRLADSDSANAQYALEAVKQIDAEKDDAQQSLLEAEAVLSEWSQPPDMDAALDFYAGLTDLVRGRVTRADGAQALNAALHDVLEGIWFEIEPDRDRLLAEFELRGQPQTMLPDGAQLPAGFKQQRPTLPPILRGAPIDPVAVLPASNKPSGDADGTSIPGPTPR